MGLDSQISFASKALYFMGIMAVIHCLTSGFLPMTWVLGSGTVDLGSAYVLAGRIVAASATDPLTNAPDILGLGMIVGGFALEAFGVAALFFFGFMTATRRFVALPFALIFLIVDCLVLFDKAAAIGLNAWFIGGLASFLVVFHGIVWWCVWRAFWASTQYKTNSGIVRRMDFENELRRRLSESDEPPPAAATFTTRYRRMAPPSHGSPPASAT